MEKVASSMLNDTGIDLENRDPRGINQNLQVIWEEVIGEPDGIRSPECAWRLSNHCFRLSRGCCYILLSVFIAPVTALLLGLTFACLSFQHIWCITPCLRVWRITFSTLKQFWTALVQSILLPVTDSLGYCFYNIRIFNHRLPHNSDRNDEVRII